MPTAVEDLRGQVRGTVIGPEDPGYEQARKVHNGMIDRRPAGIVGCAGVDDVVAALAWAREQGLDVAVRGGGHSAPGFGTTDGGLVIDLSPLNDVQVDPDGRTARVGGGCTWGQFNEAAHEFGLATTGGIISTTGVSGLTLGGGIGYLARGFGLACDNMISAELVTADGRTLTASGDENPELLWALRGGGGNFGIVTSFQFRLHPVGEIYGGPIVYPIDRTADVLTFFDQFIAGAPREMGGFSAVALAPPLPFIPEEYHLKPVALVVACWAGDASQGEAAVRPLVEAAPVVGSFLGPMPYPAINKMFDELLPAGLRSYWKSNFLREISEQQLAVHLEYGPKVPTVQSAVHFYPINGAVHDVGLDESAFPSRDARYGPVFSAFWEDPAQDEANIRWVRDYVAALAPFVEEGGYINFMSGDDQDRIKTNYGGAYERLAHVKRTYDPDNVFHLNQNIMPAQV